MKKYLDALIYVTLTSIAFVFIDKIGQRINSMLLLFMMALITMLWFHVINFGKIKQIYVACFTNVWLFLSLMIFIAINWICSIYAPSAADPFIYLAANFISQAIFGYVHVFIKTKSKTSLLSMIALVICLIILYNNYEILDGRSIDVGMLLGGISGLMGYVYAIFSGKMHQRTDLSSTQILAVRFWFLVIGLGIFIGYNYQLIHLSLTNFFITIGMAFITLIIPIYFLQQTIKKNGAQVMAKMAARVPLVVFVLYSLSQLKFNWGNFVVCIAITIALRIPDLVKLFKK